MSSPTSLECTDEPHLCRQRGCGVQIDQARILAAEQEFQSLPQPEQEVSENSTATLNIIFHVIYTNETTEGGYLSDKAIYDQVDVLNEDYINTGLSFNLANVTRANNPDWFNNIAPGTKEEQTMKEMYRQGGPADLNVYTVGVREEGAKPLLGYSTFPMEYAARPLNDGVVLLHSTLPGGSSAPFNKGRTLTHEVGHWMGLYHTFQGGCEGPGDEVDDTPAEAEAAYGCPVQRDTCFSPGEDPIFNFMNYVDDECMNMFTIGQIARIRAQMRAYRRLAI
ncbi:hypothetical protein CVT24_007038 [Panaeolus cyanescens]|uniref:Peptidase M43 pregnancy-associated plasma-A domain-containing protein n=1 Tax=Panaeolus cyanescens TaxID=181874 RepID=A0A409WA01_9AGAR|nr:hypothetical protein CVT24_007038 [Panaeolus cyanescens]